MAERKDNYGVIIHPEDFDEILNVMSPEEAGHIIKNMIRAFKGDELEVFEERYLNLATNKLCGRVIREKHVSDLRAIAGANGGKKGGAPKGNQNATKNKAKTNQNQSKNKAKQSSNTNTNTNTNTNIKNIYGVRENVLLTDEEHQKVIDAGLTDLIDELSLYIDSKGAKYKSHYSTILAWARRREKENKGNGKTYQFQQMQKTDYDMDALERRLVKN